MWSVEDDLRQRIEQALGSNWPAEPSEVASYLARLQVEHPQLYREAILMLSGSSVPLTTEIHQRRQERRRRARHILFGWAQKQSQTGDLLPRRRRILAAVMVGTIGMLFILMSLAAMGRRDKALPKKDVPPASQESPVGKPEVPEVSSKPAIPPLLPSLPLPFPEGSLPQPGTTELEPQRNPSRRRSASRSSDRVVIFEAEAPKDDSPLLLFEAATPVAEVPQESSEGRTDQGAIATLRHEPSEGISPFVIGRRLAGRLLTGIAIIPGISTPVVAETKDPEAHWIGEATINKAGLVELTFSLVVQEGQEHRGVAIALDPEGQRPGVQGHTSIQPAARVSSILGASIRGVADYTQALLRRQRVTLTNGWASISSDEPPPLWTLIAARIAEALLYSQRDPRPVPVTEVPAGTPITILVLQGGSDG